MYLWIYDVFRVPKEWIFLSTSWICLSGYFSSSAYIHSFIISMPVSCQYFQASEGTNFLICKLNVFVDGGGLVVMLCCFVDGCQCFRGTFACILQDHSVARHGITTHITIDIIPDMRTSNLWVWLSLSCISNVCTMDIWSLSCSGFFFSLVSGYYVTSFY